MSAPFRTHLRLHCNETLHIPTLRIRVIKISRSALASGIASDKKKNLKKQLAGREIEVNEEGYLIDPNHLISSEMICAIRLTIY